MDTERKIVLDTDEIERLRKEKGWSVTHLVERAGISRPTYYKVLALSLIHIYISGSESEFRP